jgi:hypothetical protein
MTGTSSPLIADRVLARYPAAGRPRTAPSGPHLSTAPA